MSASSSLELPHFAQVWWEGVWPTKVEVPVKEFVKALGARFPKARGVNTAASTSTDYDTFYEPQTSSALRVLVEYIIDENHDGFVDKKEFAAFIGRFGPFQVCVDKAFDSIFDRSTKFLHAWFHGPITDKESKRQLEQHRAGSFLVRYRTAGKKQDRLTLEYTSVNPARKGYLRKLHIMNTSSGYTCKYLKPGVVYTNLTELIESNRDRCKYTVQSKLYGDVLRSVLESEEKSIADNYGTQEDLNQPLPAKASDYDSALDFEVLWRNEPHRALPVELEDAAAPNPSSAYDVIEEKERLGALGRSAMVSVCGPVKADTVDGFLVRAAVQLNIPLDQRAKYIQNWKRACGRFSQNTASFHRLVTGPAWELVALSPTVKRAISQAVDPSRAQLTRRSSLPLHRPPATNPAFSKTYSSSKW